MRLDAISCNYCITDPCSIYSLRICFVFVLLLSFILTGFTAYASHLNYPGGSALQILLSLQIRGKRVRGNSRGEERRVEHQYGDGQHREKGG
jgi:hypothetical protein